MKRVALLLACAAALAAALSVSAAGMSVVRADGRIGQFRIDVTTASQLRARLGRPERVQNEIVPPNAKPTGQTLVYSCGAGCETWYSFNLKTGTLSDFQTASPSFATVHGSHVGLTGADASKLEGRPPLPGCGASEYLHLRWDRKHEFVLVLSRGIVTSMAYLGAHSVIQSLC